MGMQALALVPGIFPTAPGAAGIVTSTTSRDLKIAPAVAAISAPLGGWYTPSWSSTVTVTPAAGGSQDRIDVIAVSAHDYEVDATQVLSTSELVVLPGVASATPSAPSVGDGQLGLYQVRVHAGDTSSNQFAVTRMFTRTAPLDGIPEVPSTASLGTLPQLPGLQVRDASTGYVWRYSASAGWVLWNGVASVSGTNYYGTLNAARPLGAIVTSGLVTLSGAFVRTGGPYSLGGYSETPIGTLSGVVMGIAEIYLPIANNSGVPGVLKVTSSGGIIFAPTAAITVNTGMWVNVAGVTFPVVS